jgi:hypothetical protein
MDSQEHQVVMARALESRKQNYKVRALLQQRATTSRRALLARCAIDLAIEHHSGIVRLIQVEEYGTAAALLRPLLEANTAAFWLMYVAQCDYILSLSTSTATGRSVDIPQLDRMAKALVHIFPPIQTLVDGLKNNGPASWLHKYTHGGMPQLLRRRFGWSEGEVMHMLIAADIFAILGPCLETVIAPNAELSTYAFSRRDDLGDELSRIFDVPSHPRQPHELPAALTDGCDP